MNSLFINLNFRLLVVDQLDVDELIQVMLRNFERNEYN